MSPDVSPLLQRLRAATADLHAAIETNPAFARLTDATLTRAGYCQTLRGLQAFHAGLEPRLTLALGSLADELGVSPGRWSEPLALDLATFGMVPDGPAPSRVLPVLGDPAAALGTLYVLEGSSLGGRVIARHLADRLGLCARTGAGFFDQPAEEVRARWRRLLAVLSDIGVPGPPADRLVAKAQETFRCLDRWMLLAATPGPRPEAHAHAA